MCGATTNHINGPLFIHAQKTIEKQSIKELYHPPRPHPPRQTFWRIPMQRHPVFGCQSDRTRQGPRPVRPDGCIKRAPSTFHQLESALRNVRADRVRDVERPVHEIHGAFAAQKGDGLPQMVACKPVWCSRPAAACKVAVRRHADDPERTQRSPAMQCHVGELRPCRQSKTICSAIWPRCHRACQVPCMAANDDAP